MSAPRTPAQRAQFVDSAASELDVSPAAAHRLLELSEAARRHAVDPDWLDLSRSDVLLDQLQDDAFCEHARGVAADEGEQLWRQLFANAGPPRDVGPALLLAVALDARCAADEAYEVLSRAVRPSGVHRWAIELAVDLAEDGGDPVAAWRLLERLAVDGRHPRYWPLQCLVRCAVEGDCPSARLAGAARARWLWGRAKRWVRLPWADMRIGAEAGHMLVAEGGSLAEIVREFGSLRGPGPMGPGLFGYLRSRWRRLPTDERELLLRWLRTRWGRFSVLEATPHELVLHDDAGGQHVAGTEEPSGGRTWEPGDLISGWLLPTAVIEEHLFVLNTAPAAWSR